jgi:prolipoprotein diacylglyceryltransferase
VLLPSDDAAEWGRKIIEVYMGWYTFFMTTNVALMGWFAGKDAKDYDPKPRTAVSLLFIVLNLFGVCSTLMVSHSVRQLEQLPAPFYPLILWAGIANTGGLLGNIFIWIYLIRLGRKTQR